MSEMTVKEYLSIKSRMTNNCIMDCEGCALHPEKTGAHYGCQRFEQEYPESAIAIVKEWGERNPEKTFLDDFKEKHPNAPLTVKGTPVICPDQVGYGERSPRECRMIDDDRCVKCWGRVMEVEF